MSSHNDGFRGRPGTDPRHIPTRLNYSNYLRYERYIKDFMLAWPHPVAFTPENINLDTFAKNFRYAVKSVLDFQWTGSDLDVPRLAEIWQAAKVSTQPTQVIVGPRDGIAPPETQQTVHAARHLFELDCTDVLATKAAIVLCARGVFQKPILLRGDPQPAHDYIVSHSYDVHIHPLPEAGDDAFLML